MKIQTLVEASTEQSGAGLSMISVTAQRAVENGGNVLGLHPDSYHVVNVLLLTYWVDKKDDERVTTSFMQKDLKRIEKNAEDKGQSVPWVYWNYAFSDQDALRSYGDENVRKLQEASKKYDPNGVFQTACPGGFKLFK